MLIRPHMPPGIFSQMIGFRNIRRKYPDQIIVQAVELIGGGGGWGLTMTTLALVDQGKSGNGHGAGHVTDNGPRLRPGSIPGPPSGPWTCPVYRPR